jgi:hypothetical protein
MRTAGESWRRRRHPSAVYPKSAPLNGACPQRGRRHRRIAENRRSPSS